ncbi:MAG: RHS repeat-associated core domain-containing protein [Pirellulales bacterium]
MAISNASGSVVERVAYTAYGQPTFTNASGSVLSSSAKATRYTYTGREWDTALELYHFRARWMSGAQGKFMSRDPIEYRGSKWGLQEFLGSRALSKMDPLGKITVGECNDVLENWWTNSGQAIVDMCKKSKLDLPMPVCKVCDKNQPSTAGCKGDGKGNYSGIEITLCANEFRSRETMLLNIKHEMQHAKDICTCKEGCLLLAHEKGKESLQAYCKEKACLEIRACIVGDCEGKSTEVDPATNSSPMATCVWGCAMWSVENSEKCKKNAKDYVAGVWKQCFSTESPLPSFPNNL